MTRDDVKWTVLMVLAVIASLALLSEGVVRELGLPLAIVPLLPWCRLVTMLAGVVGAKLGNSPLPGRGDPPLSQSTLDKIAASVPIVMIAALIGLAPLTAGCGPKQYHTAVVANTSIAQAIFAVQDAEIAAHTAGLITADKHAAYKAEILTLLKAGDDLTLALKEWDPAQPVPANVGLAIGKVQLLLTDLQINSPQASALLYTVQTVLSVLRGTGVLPADGHALLGAASQFGKTPQRCQSIVADLSRSEAQAHINVRKAAGDYVETFDDVLAVHAPILLPEVARG